MNTFATFTQTELVSMVSPVRAEQPSADDATEVFARAAWSGIVEPGDRVAGMLWSALGVQQSLDSVISDEAPERMAARIGERLGGESAEGGANLTELIGEALGRWRPRLSASEASAHLNRAARLRVSFTIPGDEHWPTQLDDLGAHRPAGL